MKNILIALCCSFAYLAGCSSEPATDAATSNDEVNSTPALAAAVEGYETASKDLVEMHERCFFYEKLRFAARDRVTEQRKSDLVALKAAYSGGQPIVRSGEIWELCHNESKVRKCMDKYTFEWAGKSRLELAVYSADLYEAAVAANREAAAKLVFDALTAANAASAKLCTVLGQSDPKRAEACELDALNQLNLILEQTSRDLPKEL